MIVRLNRNGRYWQARWTSREGRRMSRGLGLISEVSKREAEKMCAEIGHAESSSPTPCGKAPTLAQWRDKYIQLRDKTLSDGTLYLHGLTFDYLIARFGEGAKLDKLTRVSAAEWRAGLGLGEQSTCLHVRNAKVIFAWAVDLDIIKANPFDRENGTPAATDKAWAEIGASDMAKILDACPDDGWRHLFALCRWAGLRRGEALRVRWSDIEWGARVLTVRAERVTTKAKARTVPMEPRLFDLLLMGYEAAEDGSEFPTDGVSGHNLDKRASDIVAAAGVPTYAKPFHTLRKCRETEWMAVHPVMDVAAWLGHSPAVAARHYVRTTPETLARVTGQETATIPPQTQKQTTAKPS